MLSVAGNLQTQPRSDTWEAFHTPALDSYSNDLAHEVALSVAWIRQKQKTKQNIKHNVINSLPVTKELFLWLS